MNTLNRACENLFRTCWYILVTLESFTSRPLGSTHSTDKYLKTTMDMSNWISSIYNKKTHDYSLTQKKTILLRYIIIVGYPQVITLWSPVGIWRWYIINKMNYDYLLYNYEQSVKGSVKFSIINKYNHTSRSNLQGKYCYKRGRSENWQDPSEWKKIYTYLITFFWLILFVRSVFMYKNSLKDKMHIPATFDKDSGIVVIVVLPLSLAWTRDFQIVREMILPRHARLIHWTTLWTKH